MTVTELATTFTALCAEGKFEEAVQSYWSDDIVFVEPMDSTRITMDEHALYTVKDGKVIGPPKDNLVLEGVRYGLIEELCRNAGIAFELRKISRQEVLNADELLLSSATKEVIAITQLDGKPVGAGLPGPVAAILHAGYQIAKAHA